MIDFHSHILFEMDDGSRSGEESVAMLTALAEQGVELVAATPHFYPFREDPDTFLKRRAAAYERLRPLLREGHPTIRLGAEVAYYSGISRSTELHRLTLEGTGILLLEMPPRPWSDSEIGEVIDLSCVGQMTTVLAHIERYPSLKNNEVLDLLISRGVLMQGGTEPFFSFFSSRLAISRLKSGRIHLLGSDCHNMTSRPPRYGEAIARIRKKLGGAALDALDAFAHELIDLHRKN